MSDILVKKFTASDFDPDKYILQLCQESVGGLELKQHRQKIQQLSEDANTQLKKNVYMNYMQFIETAREISFLESEMYQLSHLITEQKSLLTSLLELSIAGDRGHVAQEVIEINPVELKEKKKKENRKKLTALLEKVERCSHVMEVEDRHLLFDGDLLELKQSDYTAKQRIHVYLLNDSLMIATWLSDMNDRRGPVRYRFENLYSLDQVLPVNIKDREGIKDAFKLLIFPDTRVFQASNAKNKQDWLGQLERAKQNKAIADKEKAVEQHVKEKQRQLSLPHEDSLDINNPFSDEDDLSNPFIEPPPVSLGPPEWIAELPEELDQAIAQRNFEDAVDLIDRGRDYFDSMPKTPVYSEMRRTIESRVKTLIEVLQSELKVSPDKSLQGGPRAARRATTLLVHLNRSAQACELFLQHRGAILKSALKRLRLEGKTVLYVKQLCSVFFQNLLETGKEFSKAFPNKKGCVSSFVVWARNELSNFIVIFSKHVFTAQPSLSIVAECVNKAENHCQQLAEIGLDLSFAVHSFLLQDVEKTIKDGREKMLEAVKLRSQEDNWKPTSFDTKEKLNCFITEISESTGIASFEGYKSDDITLTLTNNTIQFTKVYLNFLEEVLRLFWPETENFICDCLAVIFNAHLMHCRNSLEEGVLSSEFPTIRRNCAFLLDVVLPLTEHRYAEYTGYPLTVTSTFHSFRPHLTGEGDLGPTTVGKYESNFL